MIKRQISPKILDLQKKYPITAIIGPRQSGKTTLVKALFPEKQYVNLEDIEMREYATMDPKGFLSEYNDGAVIDEVQRVPELLSSIQVIVDQEQAKGKYVLTGSQNFLLMEKISQSLAGRVAIFKLMPFSLMELRQAKIEYEDFKEYLYKGFYPRLYDENIEATGYYHNYLQTYVERDVRLIKNITDLDNFLRFIRMCAARTGHLLNLTSLAEDCGISHNTVKSWLSVLETSFIIYRLRPHYKNYNKRLVKMPKIYFYDTGLLCALLGIENISQLSTHYLRGSIFESFVISEFMKYRFNQGAEPNCYFWRDKHGKEIDCIIEQANRLIPIEIKSGKTIVNDYFKNLKYYNNLAGINPSSSYVIYGGNEKQARSYGNVAGWKFLDDVMRSIKKI